MTKKRRGHNPGELFASGPHRDAVRQMLPQLLIALVKRNGGTMEIPVSEVDDTAGENLAFKVSDDQKSFVFVIQKKQKVYWG